MAAATAALILGACGGSAATGPERPQPRQVMAHPLLRECAAAAGPTSLPRQYQRVLADKGFQYFYAWRRVGRVVAVAATATGTPHNQAVFFVANGRVVATDLIDRQTHFDARLCGSHGRVITTGYLLNMGPIGHLPGCPAVTFIRVRWQVRGTRVHALDRVPPPCYGR